MNIRSSIAPIALIGVCLGLAAPLRAHRLDEYLQAARISVASDRVTLELDLTPGVAIAPAVLAMIDTDRNGQISATEGDAYARSVIDGLAMKVDGHPVQPRLERRHVPAPADLKEGTGSIRLSASAVLPTLAEGPHQLVIANWHRADIGVYLANAMVPDDPRVEISAQRRDAAQHELTIDYALAPGIVRPAVDPWQGAAALAILAVVGVIFLKTRLSPRESVE